MKHKKYVQETQLCYVTFTKEILVDDEDLNEDEYSLLEYNQNLVHIEIGDSFSDPTDLVILDGYPDDQNVYVHKK